MSKRYTQLTEAERYHIYTMKKQGYTDTVIAQGMGRDRTTIWRSYNATPVNAVTVINRRSTGPWHVTGRSPSRSS